MSQMSLNLDFSLRRTFGVDADVEAGVETDVEADLCGSPSNLGVHALKRPPEGSGIFAKDLSKVLDVQLQLDRQVGAWSRCSVIVWLPNLSDRTPISDSDSARLLSCRFRSASAGRRTIGGPSPASDHLPAALTD